MLAVKPNTPQPDIGSVLDALARHRPVELDCRFSPTEAGILEVQSRLDLEECLVERFPFRPRMFPIDRRGDVAVGIVLVGGPPIRGEGNTLVDAIQSLLRGALEYIDQWEHHLRFGAEHQRHWGWVYRLLLAGDEQHILATLLNEPA